MQNATTIAGLGFGNSNTGLSHALGHSAGAVFHLPHGRAIGIALPYSLIYIASHPPIQGAQDPVERLAVLARFVGIDNPSPKDAVDAFIGLIKSIQKEIGEPLSLRDAGITEDRLMREIETLVRIAEKDPNMYTTPCECKGKALRDLFETMWRG